MQTLTLIIFFAAIAIPSLITGMYYDYSEGLILAGEIAAVEDTFSGLSIFDHKLTDADQQLKQAYKLLKEKDKNVDEVFFTCNPRYPCIPYSLIAGVPPDPPVGFFSNSYIGRVEDEWVNNDLYRHTRHCGHGFLVKAISVWSFDPQSPYLTEEERLFLEWYNSWKDNPQFQIFKQLYVSPLDPGFDTTPTKLRIAKFDYCDIEIGRSREYVDRSANNHELRPKSMRDVKFSDCSMEGQTRLLPHKPQFKNWFTTYEVGFTRGYLSDSQDSYRHVSYNQNVRSIVFGNNPPTEGTEVYQALLEFISDHPRMYIDSPAVDFYALNDGSQRTDINLPQVITSTPKDTTIVKICEIISQESKIPFDQVVTTMASTLVHDGSHCFAYCSKTLTPMSEALEQLKKSELQKAINSHNTHSFGWTV